jgi:DNA processing protein
LLEERAYWLAWSQIDRIGPTLMKRMYQHFGSLAEAWRASETALRAVEGLGSKSVGSIPALRSQIDPEALLSAHLRQNPQFWTPSDRDYPRLLWEIPSPPPLLYYKGTVNALENEGKIFAIAIVGTRYPTEHGQRWTKRLAQVLSQRGFTIVSGMAAGIDGIAHQSALQAGGRTLAVLGTGIDQIYPPNHRTLYDNIQQQGLILSEYPAGTLPNRVNFPARNRIIAGLTRATLVLEAPEKSGSLITARYANEFGRDVYTLPNSPDVSQAKGCLRLLTQGATIILDGDELLEQLGAIPQLDPAKSDYSQQLSLLDAISPSITPSLAPLPPDLSPEWTAILQVISFDPTPFDTIVQATGLSTGEISSILLQLELQGLVAQLPGMRYQRTHAH